MSQRAGTGPVIKLIRGGGRPVSFRFDTPLPKMAQLLVPFFKRLCRVYIRRKGTSQRSNAHLSTISSWAVHSEGDLCEIRGDLVAVLKIDQVRRGVRLSLVGPR